MIEITKLRKENASRLSGINKQLREHEKRLTEHRKRSATIETLQSKSEEKINGLQLSIDAALMEGLEVNEKQVALSSEKLNLEAYNSACIALGRAITAEEESISKLKEQIDECDRAEHRCRLIEAARAYNRQAGELAKTLLQMHEIIQFFGGGDRVIQTVFCGGNLPGIQQVFHGVRLPRIYIKESEGEDLRPDRCGPAYEKEYDIFNSKREITI